MKPLSTAPLPDPQLVRKTRSQLFREAEIAVAEMTKRFDVSKLRNAEIVEGELAKWYVVEVYASEQHDVAVELAKHRFGVYVPVISETVILRGRKIDRRIPLLSGYVFVFMWFNDRHWRWISDTPGVVSILGWIDDREIHRVRFEESCEQLSAEDRRKVEQRVLSKLHKRAGSSRRKKRRSKKGNLKTQEAA
ncbi:transcription termination/antitermination NusG family protein [Bradyrhizobium sp. WSM1417]|uniref:transcription termination/antitermination NusG family protein n=1 Tax=Bradyrhizobium sp. WSM1417 TaxID=754500 RepID=UPI000485E4DA|nr:transcription termination/antitermination NusG family protein [Bradyrhizobium sp. WSM1417]